MIQKPSLAILACLSFAATVSLAADITVISAAAVEPGLKTAVAAFERETGHKVTISFNTPPQIRGRLAAGDAFDLVIAPRAALDEFAKAGKVDASGVVLGKVGSGVAVRAGAPVPTIATADDVRKAILDADSLVFNRASTGTYFESLLKKMGIFERVEAKSKRYESGAEVMEHALKGSGKEIAFGAITEILLARERGLIFVGPYPAEIQNYTTYAATPMTSSTRRGDAQTLATFLGGPKGKALFVAAGID